MKKIVGIMLVGLATAFGASAQGTITRGPLEFTFNANMANPLAGNADLVWNGVDQLFQLWFWYRCPGDSAETPMPAPDVENYNQQDALILQGWWDICGYQTTLNINIYDCSSDSCFGGGSGPWWQIRVYVFHSDPAVQTAFFIYSDFDVAGTPENDMASSADSPDISVRDGGTIINIVAPYQLSQVTAWPVLRDALNDVSLTDLDGTGLPFGPADFTAAFQRENDNAMYFSFGNLPFSDTFESGDASAWSTVVP